MRVYMKSSWSLKIVFASVSRTCVIMYFKKQGNKQQETKLWRKYYKITPDSRNGEDRQGPRRAPLINNGSANKFRPQPIYTQQRRNYWRLCFSYGPNRSYVKRTGLWWTRAPLSTEVLKRIPTVRSPWQARINEIISVIFIFGYFRVVYNSKSYNYTHL